MVPEPLYHLGDMRTTKHAIDVGAFFPSLFLNSNVLLKWLVNVSQVQQSF